jgi:hypothetical protein
MSFTKLSLARNNLIFPGQREFGTVSVIPAGDRKTLNFFYSVFFLLTKKVIVEYAVDVHGFWMAIGTPALWILMAFDWPFIASDWLRLFWLLASH